MSEFNDPFATADEAQTAPEPEAFEPPAEPETPAPAKKAPAKKAAPKAESTPDRPVIAIGEGKLVTTLKGGAAFTDPWIVLHAESLEETEEFFGPANASRLAALMERVQAAGKHFVKVGGGSAAPAQQRQAPPAAAQQPPGGETRTCRHGEMRFRSGVSKAGKPYKAFFCASNNRDDECKAEFLR